jgi:hypothetical protein
MSKKFGVRVIYYVRVIYRKKRYLDFHLTHLLLDVLDENINTLFKIILDHSVMYQATHFKSKTH